MAYWRGFSGKPAAEVDELKKGENKGRSYKAQTNEKNEWLQNKKMINIPNLVAIFSASHFSTRKVRSKGIKLRNLLSAMINNVGAAQTCTTCNLSSFDVLDERL